MAASTLYMIGEGKPELQAREELGLSGTDMMMRPCVGGMGGQGGEARAVE